MTRGARGGHARRGRDDRGSALVEFTWLAILLLVPLLYIVLAVFEVQRAAFGVSAAARGGARAFVLAPDEAAAADRARQAVHLALDDQGLDEENESLALGCTPRPAHCLVPGSTVTVVVGYQVPLPLLPSALGGQRPSVRVEAEHTVPYGSYRQDRP